MKRLKKRCSLCGSPNHTILNCDDDFEAGGFVAIRKPCKKVAPGTKARNRS